MIKKGEGRTERLVSASFIACRNIGGHQKIINPKTAMDFNSIQSIKKRKRRYMMQVQE